MILAAATEMFGMLGSRDWLPLVAFGLAILILEFFDISLPRGDTLGVSGALDSAAVVLLGPGPAMVAGVIGTVAAFLARRGTDRHTQPTVEIPSLLAAFAAAILVDRVFAGAAASVAALYARPLVVAFSYLLAELVVVQLLMAKGSTRTAGRLIRGNIVRQAPLLAAQLSASVLAVITYPKMGPWGLGMVVVLLLLIRQSYAMLLGIRETYRTTVEVLVEAAESADGQRRGHAERTAAMAREIGSACGLSPSEVETVSYAALLHDVDAIGHDARYPRPVCKPSEVLDGVGSFEGVARVLRVFEGGMAPPACADSELLGAYVVALANDIDAADCGAVKSLHPSSALHRLRLVVPQEAKARAVAAAVRLGFRVPVVS